MNIFDILEDKEFSPCILDDRLECRIETPAGEDFYFDLAGKNEQEWEESLHEYVRQFDIDEYVELFIQLRGKYGVPDSISELVKDAEWIKNRLEELVDSISKYNIYDMQVRDYYEEGISLQYAKEMAVRLMERAVEEDDEEYRDYSKRLLEMVKSAHEFQEIFEWLYVFEYVLERDKV